MPNVTAFQYRGEWQRGASYGRNNVVEFDGETYICTRPIENSQDITQEAQVAHFSVSAGEPTEVRHNPWGSSPALTSPYPITTEMLTRDSRYYHNGRFEPGGDDRRRLMEKANEVGEKLIAAGRSSGKTGNLLVDMFFGAWKEPEKEECERRYNKDGKGMVFNNKTGNSEYSYLPEGKKFRLYDRYGEKLDILHATEKAARHQIKMLNSTVKGND